MAERIMVAVRVRPLLPFEAEAPSCVSIAQNQISVGAGRVFAFDRVFSDTASSDDVYVALGQPLADAVLSGYHASTIAYGQTGAGKTFTMATLLSDTVQEVFCRLAEDATEGDAAPFTMTLSVLEVYNEAIGDLLASPTSPLGDAAEGGGGGGGSRRRRSSRSCSRPKRLSSVQPGSTGQERPPPRRRASASTSFTSVGSSLALREDPQGGVYVVGLTERQVRSEAELLALIDGAIGNRKTASTLMNATSSRSHCVVTLTLQRRGLCSRCCFVDLAGSERLKKSLGLAMTASDRVSGGSTSPVEASLLPSGTAAARMREGININGGLLALGNVIVALCERKTHVPYRSSKLTRLLQPMLGGGARTAIIACVAPVASSLEETLNTLKYAARAKCIPIDPHLAMAAVVSSPTDAQQTIALLRDQLEDAHRRLIAVTATTASGTPTTAASPVAAAAAAAAATRELENARELLRLERELTLRLQSDLFTAEYTTMIEVEKRKASEGRVESLERAYAAAVAALASRGGPSATAVAEVGDRCRSASSSSSLPLFRVAATAPSSRTEEEEAEEQQQQQRRSTTAVLEDDCDDGDRTVVALSEDIAAKEDVIAQLQKERDDVAAQLTQYEDELRRTLSHQAELRAELRKAEAQLEVSEMARDLKEQEKEKLRATYEQRLRRVEGLTADYRRRVEETSDRVRERQAALARTRKLRETVVQLREEVSRQRLRVRAAEKASEQRSAAHQHEVAQLQRQLQLSAAQAAVLHQRVNRKEATMTKARKLLAVQPPVRQAAHRATSPVPAHRPRPGRTPSASLSASPTSLATIDTPPRPGTQTSAAAHSSPPPPPPLPQRRRQRSRRTSLRGGGGGSGDATQATINEELCELERMEKELAELLEYRRVLLSAQVTDAPKWLRAKDGFTQRLSQVQAELRAVEPGQAEHTALLREMQEVEEKLRQLHTFHHMFTDADQQLAEFDNRIENLNEARRFHTQRVRQLQRVRGRPHEAGGEAVVAEEEKAPPSVREIRTARGGPTAR